MRKLALVILSFLLASCDIYFVDDIFSNYRSNPFLVSHEFQTEGDTIRFLVFSDAHIGKKGTVDHSGTIVDLAQRGDFDAVISIGDTIENGDIDDPALISFFSNLASSSTVFIQILGNHELHGGVDSAAWQDLFSTLGIHGPVGRYTFSDQLSLYALDSSKRIFSKRQLDWLEEALEEDDSKYRILLSHVDTTSGEDFDKSLIFVLGQADLQERERLFGMMADHGVGLMLTGHRHIGGGLVTHRGFYEYNVPALVEEDAFLEDLGSRGEYCIITIDLSSGQGEIERCMASDGSCISRVSIDL